MLKATQLHFYPKFSALGLLLRLATFALIASSPGASLSGEYENRNAFFYPFVDSDKKAQHRDEGPRILRHIFHTKEEKSLDISNLWNYEFRHKVYKNGAKMEASAVPKHLKFKRNVTIKKNQIYMRKTPMTFIKHQSNEIRVFSFSDETSNTFIFQRRLYDMRSLKSYDEAPHMETTKNMKCLSHSVYAKETVFLCVQRVAGFEFYSATRNEQLLIMRCLHNVKSCRKYTFNYGAQAYFLWVFNRFFGIFSDKCKFKYTTNDNEFNLSRGVRKNYKAQLKSLKSMSQRDLMFSSDLESSRSASDEREIKNYFLDADADDVGHKFDHCFLKNTFIARTGTKSLVIGFTPVSIPGSIYIELELNNNSRTVGVRNNKEASFMQTSVTRIVHLEFDLVILVEEGSFYVGSEREFVKNISNLRQAEVSSYFYENRRYLSHYLNMDKFQLAVYSISRSRNVEMMLFEVGVQGRIAHVQTLQLFLNEQMAETFLFVHMVKSIFIFGIKTTNMIEKKIKICVNYSMNIPFEKTCGFNEWIRVSRTVDLDDFQIDFIEQNDRVIMYFDNQLVTIYFREPLYEIVLHTPDPELDAPLNPHRPRSVHLDERDEDLEQQHLSCPSTNWLFDSAEIELDDLIYKYEIEMESNEGSILLILETTLDNNPLWLGDQQTNDAKNNILIDKAITFVPQLKGNLKSMDDRFLSFDYTQRSTIVIQLRRRQRPAGRSGGSRKLGFTNMENYPVGFLKIKDHSKGNPNSSIKEMILFKKHTEQGGVQYFALLRRRSESEAYSLIQMDSELQRSQTRTDLEVEGRFLGTTFNKELLFYDGDNFYSKLADFDSLELNTNILKVKCSMVFVMDYDPGLSLLFCFSKSVVKAFMRSKDSRVFEGPLRIEFKDKKSFLNKRFGGIRCLSKFSKIIVNKVYSRNELESVVFYLVKIEKIQKNQHPESPKKKATTVESEASHLINEDANVYVRRGFQSFSGSSGGQKKRKDSAKRAGADGAGELEERQIVIKKLAEWNLRLSIRAILGFEGFVISSLIVMEKRIFALVTLDNGYSRGFNFKITSNYDIILMYKVEFESMIDPATPLKIVEVMNLQEYPTDDFNRSLILLKGYIGDSFYTLHFYPEQSYLQAFPIISKDTEIAAGSIVVPIELFDTQSPSLSSPLLSSGTTSQVELSVTFFTVRMASRAQMVIHKMSVTRFPFFRLLDHSFKNNRQVTVYNGNKSESIEFHLSRFERGETNMLSFSGDEETRGFVNLEAMTQFPVEIQVDLSKVRGNVFSYHIESENHLESENGLIKMETMVDERSIFRGRTGSLMQRQQISLDKEARLMYLYNKDLLWILDEEGRLLGSWFINKYITCSSRLLQEFGNSSERESVFYDVEKNLMVRIIQSKKLTALVVYRIQTPHSKKYDEINKIKDSRRDMPEFDNDGLKMMVVNEKLITENMLHIRFHYSDDILTMHSEVDSNRSLVLYFWKNLVNSTDCPVSLSLEGSSHFRYKVIRSVLFSPDFKDTECFHNEKRIELKGQSSLLFADGSTRTLAPQRAGWGQDQAEKVDYDEMFLIDDKERTSFSVDSSQADRERGFGGREHSLRILAESLELSSGEMADDESEFTEYSLTKQRHKTFDDRR